MCGICAYIGYDADPYDKIYMGLHMLQNRGYDSMGVSTICNETGELIVKKRASTMSTKAIDYMKSIQEEFSNHQSPKGSAFIGHSRWRTCGSKTDQNAHPHLSYNKKFSLVHNGIIENYREIRRELEDKGITFNSQTDSEVIVNLIENYYECGKFESVEDAINEALCRLEGTWGLVIICNEEPDKLYCARHGSPLLIGFGDNFMMVASEQVGFAQYIDNYICLNEKDLVVLHKNNGKVEIIKQPHYEIREVSVGELQITPDPFPHWTLKEIHEQRESSMRSIGGMGRILNDNEVRLGGLNSHSDILIDIDNLIILGCGTSYNAGMYALDCFRKISGFNTVQLFDGANFSKTVLPLSGKTGILLLSQSGETKDLHAALEIAQNEDIVTIGVVNVVDSMIAREVDCGVYVNAGREVGVASTKCFTSQVIVLHLIAVWFAQNRNISQGLRYKIIQGLRSLPRDIETTIQMCQEHSRNVSSLLSANKQPIFILGKDTSEAIARESALKIKELSYIFAEAYNSSALKHGPYSCIKHDTIIISLIPNDSSLQRNLSTIDELISRDAYVISVGRTKTHAQISIQIPKNDYFEALLGVIPMQLVAYYTALSLGNNVDQPRGLAKTVTTF